MEALLRASPDAYKPFLQLVPVLPPAVPARPLPGVDAEQAAEAIFTSIITKLVAFSHLWISPPGEAFLQVDHKMKEEFEGAIHRLSNKRYVRKTPTANPDSLGVLRRSIMNGTEEVIKLLQSPGAREYSRSSCDAFSHTTHLLNDGS